MWVVCVCGYDPTDGDSYYQVESVLGGTDNSHAAMALDVWNDKIQADEEKEAAGAEQKQT